MRTENWQSDTPGLRLVGEEESGSVLSPYGPMKAGLTTSHSNQQLAQLSVLLNSLEREVEILHSKYCEAYVILIRRYGTPCKAYKFSLTHRYY
jgi:hypothetical protein